MRIPILGCGLGWSGLGFYRGMMDYQHTVSKYEHPYLYTSQFLHGIAGTICYLNPCLVFIFVPKELYRLEVNLRGMEHEKTTDKYNEIM
jgi:hypothetical protein